MFVGVFFLCASYIYHQCCIALLSLSPSFSLSSPLAPFSVSPHASSPPSLSLSLSLSMDVSLSLSVYGCPSLPRSHSISFCLSLCLSVCLVRVSHHVLVHHVHTQEAKQSDSRFICKRVSIILTHNKKRTQAA